MAFEELQEGQLVLCTVERIIGTTVFVKVEENREGTITLSEIAPGRIRNLRDYVIPGKRIVCKILNIKENVIHLSLRRVGVNEKKDFLQKVDKEKSNKAILKTVLGELAEKVIAEITKTQSLTDLFEEAKENPEILDTYLKKPEAEKIIKILESKKEKPKEIRQIVKLSNKSSDGMTIVKNILNESCKDSKCEVSYLAAGKYRINFTGKDFKTLKSANMQTIDSIEKLAKKTHSEFAIEKE
jgi:translation initiation factor 2 alpha subunit (eIF-2alpha)